MSIFSSIGGFVSGALGGIPVVGGVAQGAFDSVTGRNNPPQYSSGQPPQVAPSVTDLLASVRRTIEAVKDTATTVKQTVSGGSATVRQTATDLQTGSAVRELTPYLLIGGAVVLVVLLTRR